MTGFGDGEVGNTNRVGSVAAADNDSGFDLVHERIGGRPFVNAEYDVGGDAVVIVEGRYEDKNGSLSEWQEYDRVDTSETDVDNDDLIQLPWVSYDQVRVRTDTTGIDVAFIISGTR